jgi:hypothetical protein
LALRRSVKRVCLGIDAERCAKLTDRARCPRHAREHERRRVARRGDLYAGDWPATSKRIRDEEPWCHCTRCSEHPDGCYALDDLTVDHHDLAAYCRSCHGRLEAARRRDACAT